MEPTGLRIVKLRMILVLSDGLPWLGRYLSYLATLVVDVLGYSEEILIVMSPGDRGTI